MQKNIAQLALRAALLSGVVAASFSLSACKAPPYPQCKKDKHCHQEEGEKCVDGMCQNCWADTDCVGKGPNGEDWMCVENRCAEKATTGGPGEEGSPCTTSDGCNPGLTCKDGICSKCMADSDCSSGMTCNMNSNLCETNMGNCQCKIDDDCSMEQICESCQCVDSNANTAGSNPCGLTAVYFDFDSPRLTAKTQQDLQAAADCIKQQSRSVHLEAHADPRGTEEYNILLTDRRGQTVKTFLQNLGVPGDHMNVVSKGSMEARGADESSWAMDRRVEFVWQQ
jgi:peptidoglycan-associated lipoprotein